jgi:hypothetical protein
MKQLEKVIKKASAYLKNERLGTEREKRLTLKQLPPECASLRPVRIQQGFIKEVKMENRPHCDVRIRRKGEGRGHFSMTAKFRPLKHEAETKISEEIWESLWPRATSRQIKDRYTLENGWTIDLIKPEGRVVAEYHMKEGQKDVEIPKTFAVVSETIS